jgi:hypothetical protein
MPSGNPFDVPTGTPQAASSAPAAAVTPKGNPFDVGGNTPSAPSSAPMFARTPTTNPVIEALRAGNAFGKHLVTGGGFGIPDQAGEDADDVKLNAIIDRMANVKQEGVPSWLPAPPPPTDLDKGLLRGMIDPTLLIPGKAYGAAFGLARKGLGAGLDAARPLGRYLPHAVQDAARATGDLAREGKDALGHLFRWGGKDAGKIDPKDYVNATLSSNREGANAAEEARRHTVALTGIFSGLTDAQRLDAYRVLKGEIDVASDPAVMRAARQARHYLDTNYFLKADAAGRKRVAMGSPTVANARFTPTKEANLFRYQSAPGAPAGNPLRGGTSFSMGSPSEAYASHGRGLGGENLVGRVNTAKNPLDLRVKSDTWPLPKELDLQEKISQYQGMSVARKLRPDKPTYENLRRAFESGDSKTYHRYLKALGVPPEDIAAILKHDASAGRFAGLADERIGSEMARRAGHDAIIRPPSGPRSGKGSLNPELFALHPSAHGPAKVPPRKLDPFEQAVPEGEGAPLPRHPDLPANGRSPLHLRGGEAGINRASPGLNREFAVPEPFREFIPPAKQGALGPLEYKPHYFPGLHRPPEIKDLKARPEPYNRLFPSTPEALHQRPWSIGKGELDEEGKPKLAMLDESMARSGKSTAKQTAAARLRESLGLSPGPQDASENPLIKLFEETPRAKGPARNLGEKIQDAARVPADAARASLIALGLVHGGKNVPILAGISEPKALGGMFADAVRTMRMTPEQKWEAQREAREAGVLGARMDHDNPVLRVAGKIPALARAGIGAAYGGWRGQDLENQANPQGNLAERIGGGLTGAGIGGLTGHFLPQIGKGVGGFTQAMDDAAKVNVHAAKVARGMDPAAAAMQTLRETVDYGHRTPAAKWLQQTGLAPFGQFATKVPGAVARSIKRDPRKLILADRLSGGLLTQGSIDLPQMPAREDGKPQQLSLSNPLSETIKAVTDPVGYARTKSSDLAKAAASIVSALLGGNVGNAFTGTDRKGKRDPRALYPTHGQPLLPHKDKLGNQKAGFLGESLAHLAPFGAGAGALEASGADEYQPESPLSQLLGPLIGGYVR